MTCQGDTRPEAATLEGAARTVTEAQEIPPRSDPEVVKRFMAAARVRPPRRFMGSGL